MILWQILPVSVTFLLLMVLFNIMSFSKVVSDLFIMDSFGLMLTLMPVFILFSLMSMIMNKNKVFKTLLMIMSMMSSSICFLSNNFILFFMTYELSMMSLLFSLFMKSPYSERSMAGWYFLGYLVLGGLPLLLMCLYFSLNYNNMSYFNMSEMLGYSLFTMFMTKVPLFPFHSWLPMVHAEAKSFVSMMLSGYMMKLGLLGVLRFYHLSSEGLKLYLFMFFTMSCFFFISCFCELDKKRWLAFLSLGHMSMGMGGTFSLKNYGNDVLSSFSLGHGLSVFMLFFYFYCYSNNSGSRNWVLNIMYKKSMSKVLLSFGILSLMAFPPCMLFFKEVLMFMSMGKTTTLMLMFSIYMFFSMLGPMGNLSLMTSRLNKKTVKFMDSSNMVMMLCTVYMFFLLSQFM